MLRIRNPDPHHFEKSDPDPYRNEKPDPDPHHSQKPDPVSASKLEFRSCRSIRSLGGAWILKIETWRFKKDLWRVCRPVEGM